MGAGIAQVAALGGLDAWLHDPVPEALDRGFERLRSDLARGAERGRWTADEAAAAEQRVHPVPGIDVLGICDLIVEAAPEDLELKRKLFADLEGSSRPESGSRTGTSSSRPSRSTGRSRGRCAPNTRAIATSSQTS